jgi:hypothetical protein
METKIVVMIHEMTIQVMTMKVKLRVNLAKSELNHQRRRVKLLKRAAFQVNLKKVLKQNLLKLQITTK